MSASPPTSSRCPRCDQEIDSSRAGGLCVPCVARNLLSPPATAADDDVRLPERFEFIAHLGRGGMGNVYLVYAPALARQVALKQLASGWQNDPRARERFVREASAAGRLHHPGIVPILGIGEDDSPLWYTMEYQPNGDLAQQLTERGPLPWREAVALLLRVTAAIGHAHGAGVVHRDLKPSNILLDIDGGPKVADFGLAWMAGQAGRDLTAPGEVLGTPAYLPPESLSTSERPADPRLGDIYALGALLFHLIAGRPPFVGATSLAIISDILNVPAPRLSAVSADATIPADLDKLCATCLEKRPHARFASTAAFTLALQACGAPGPRRQRCHAVRRAWRIAFVGLGVLGLTAAGGLLYPWLMARVQTAAPLLAVMPLEPIGTGEETPWLAAGLEDELIATLLRMTDVRVIAARSVHKLDSSQENFKGVRDSLGADAMLTGRVRRWTDKLWVSVQLIDTRDGATRWSRTYTSSATNVLNLQSDIATDLANHLNIDLRPAAKRPNAGTGSTLPTAQAAFVQARLLMNDASDSVGNLARAESLLNTAVAADPGFARAYAQLSIVHTQMFNWGNDRSDGRLARGLEAAQQALRLNPDLAEAEVALGLYYYRGSRDYVTAHRRLDRALALSPHHPEVLEALAHVERRQGDFSAAGRHFAEALALDPLNAILAYNTADTFLRLREYENSAALLARSLARLPNHVALLKLRGDLFAAWKGDLGPMADDIARRNPLLPTPNLYVMDRIDYLILADRVDEALQVLRESPLTTLEGQSIYLTRAGYEAILLQMTGNVAAARAKAADAQKFLARELVQRPNDTRVLLHAGQMAAVLGDLPAAERLIRRTLTSGDLACADAFDRGLYLRSYAIALAAAGAEDAALGAMRELLRQPNQTSRAWLGLHPVLGKFIDKLP